MMMKLTLAALVAVTATCLAAPPIASATEAEVVFNQASDTALRSSGFGAAVEAHKHHKHHKRHGSATH